MTKIIKGNKIITRKFSLIPDANLRQQQYKMIRDRMLKFRDLENIYIQKLINAFYNGELTLQDFEVTTSSLIANIYQKLQLTNVRANQFKSFALKERMRRCAVHYPFHAVRNWLVRNDNLKRIADYLWNSFQYDFDLITSFLLGNRLPKRALQGIYNILSTDNFGNHQHISYFFIDNLAGQIRNIFLRNTTLETVLQNRLPQIKRDHSLIQEFLQFCFSDFSYKKKSKKIDLKISELHDYFLKRYFARIKLLDTRKEKKCMEKAEFQTYKCNRDSRLDLAEDSLRNNTQSISENKIYDFGLSVFNEFVSNFETDPNIIFTKHIFSPFYTKSEISKPEECGFLKFFSGVIRNKIREHFKRLFLTGDVISTLLDDINYIRQNIPILTNIPKIKWLSVPIIAEEQVYRHDYTKGIAELSFVEREYFSFCIQDKKGRLASLLEVGAEPKVPIITFKHRKLILNLPFEVSRTDVSKPLNVESKYIEMGIDLGLTDFAVVSIKDKTDPEHTYEIDRYFIGSKQLFDMRFNSGIGKFVFRQGYTHRKSSNIKLKLINLRENIATIQRKLTEFENRCIDRGLNPKKKLKFNKLSNTFSILWDRIHNINLEIVHLLNHHIIAIANYHGASKIEMENLRFSKHAKKRERGKFLSFWQMHWLFSQIQEAIAFQAYLHNIDFERVNTSYSSQRCSKCGRVTYLDFNGNKQRTIRDGKRFVCQNVLEHTNGRIFRLDADLNAARII